MSTNLIKTVVATLLSFFHSHIPAPNLHQPTLSQIARRRPCTWSPFLNINCSSEVFQVFAIITISIQSPHLLCIILLRLYRLCAYMRACGSSFIIGCLVTRLNKNPINTYRGLRYFSDGNIALIFFVPNYIHKTAKEVAISTKMIRMQIEDTSRKLKMYFALIFLEKRKGKPILRQLHSCMRSVMLCLFIFMIVVASSILLSFAQDGESHDDHINDPTDAFPNDYLPMVIPVNGKGILIAPVITCATLENDAFISNHYPCKSAQTLLVDDDWVDKDANYTYLFEDWTDYDWNDIVVSLYATTIDVIEVEICIEDREAAWKNPFGVEITLVNMTFGVQVYWNSTDYPGENFVNVDPGEPAGIELLSESNPGDTAIVTILLLIPPKYTLTITSTLGGSTNPVPGTYLYDEGSVGSVTAIPESSYILDHWELDEVNVGIANPLNVTMNANHELHAVFEQLHTFIITSSAGGTTDPSPGSYQHSHGTEVVVTAIPGPMYTLDYWELDDVDVGSVTSISVTMNKDHTLHAIFKKIQFPPPPVGGHAIPIDLSHLLTSRMELPLETDLAFFLLVAIISTVILIRRKTRH